MEVISVQAKICAYKISKRNEKVSNFINLKAQEENQCFPREKFHEVLNYI